MELKNIFLLHHSHLDVGFTHSQVVLEELQADFLNQALDLLNGTEDWDADSQPRWTIEVHHQLKLWLESASPDQMACLKKHVASGRLGLGAIKYNTTPLSSMESLFQLLADVREYRDRFGFSVKAAFQHDVNGLPWAMTDLLLDAGIELFVMAINLHTGGNGPVRPGLFNWKTPSGRNLRVFSGHHYSGFDVVAEPSTNSIVKMKAAIDDHWHMLQEKGYPHDFLYLTATNVPVAYDNGGPSLPTANKVREWNATLKYPLIRYVSADELIEHMKRVPDDSIPTFAGDWNDYWNYGAGSAAREVTINAASKQKLFSAALLDIKHKDHRRTRCLRRKAWDEILDFEEHTWGYWAHALQPDHPQVITTEIYKRGTAHNGHEMARYILARSLADHAGNPDMFDAEGLLAVNPSPVKKSVVLNVPGSWKKGTFGRLNGFSYHHCEPLTPIRPNSFWGEGGVNCVHLELEPFSAVRIPWGDCCAPVEAEEIKEGSFQVVNEVQSLDGHGSEVRAKGVKFLESPFHVMEYDPKNGRIVRLMDKGSGWDVLPKNADYNLFEPIHEKPDPRYDASRKSYYDRATEVEMRFEACWNDDWKAARSGVSEVIDVRVERRPRTVSLIREYRIEGASSVIQRFELSADCPWIEVDILMRKDHCRSPESIYFVSQLNMEDGWSALYDSSGVPVVLDEENMPGTNRSWITQEAFTRMEQGGRQFSVFAPGMPLVQIGGFHWGKPKESIARGRNPLLLNWACNNYWETNYHITQDGVIRYNCAIHTSMNDRIADTYRMADAFSRKPLFLPLADCAERSCSTLLCLDNPTIRLASVEHAVNSDALIFRLSNPGAGTEECVFDLRRKPGKAMLVSPLEEVESVCRHESGRISVKIPPRSTVSLMAFPEG